MIVGVPKEVKDHETRVGLLPSGAKALTEAGHKVLVQAGAGIASSLPDEDWSFETPSGMVARISNRSCRIQSAPETWYGLTLNAIEIRSARDIKPISTLAPSTDIPTCILPDWIWAARVVMGGDTLIVATSNAGEAGVCPRG